MCIFKQQDLKAILENAPCGAMFYTEGYGCNYRKFENDQFYGWLDGEWKVALDQDLSKERANKGLRMDNILLLMVNKRSDEEDLPFNVDNEFDGKDDLESYEDKIYRLAIDKWGAASQVSMAQGEMGELSAALTQYFTQNKIEVNDLVDDIADVKIMLGQMQRLLEMRGDIDAGRIDARYQEKLDRLAKIVNFEN